MKVLNSILSRVCRYTYHDAHVPPGCFADCGSTVWVRRHKVTGVIKAYLWSLDLWASRWVVIPREKVECASRVDQPFPKGGEEV